MSRAHILLEISITYMFPLMTKSCDIENVNIVL